MLEVKKSFEIPIADRFWAVSHFDQKVAVKSIFSVYMILFWASSFGAYKFADLKRLLFKLIDWH